MPSEAGALTPPLVIGLDHLLITNDWRHEAMIAFIKYGGGEAWKLPYWFLKGRDILDDRLATALSEDDISALPANDEMVAFAQREAERGRRVVLATAAGPTIASRLQRRFPFITEVTVPQGDLDGRAASRSMSLSSLRKALRLHQWAKNALVFVPLILGGKGSDPAAWFNCLIAFTALGLLASATYLVNDLWDLREDRRHWSKKWRPLASGQLSIAAGARLIVGLGVLGFALGFIAGPACAATLALYLALSLAYSVRLKREPMVDIFMLATLFTMRLALGVLVADVRFSPWLFVFSMFLFLSLSAAKRQTEIVRMKDHGHDRTPGRGYRTTDAPLMLAFGIGTMVASVLIMVLYLVEEAFPTGYYRQPAFLWGFPVVMFLWLAHVWLLCHRGELRDDPVAFALRDRFSLLLGGVMLALFVAAIM